VGNVDGEVYPSKRAFAQDLAVEAGVPERTVLSRLRLSQGDAAAVARVYRDGYCKYRGRVFRTQVDFARWVARRFALHPDTVVRWLGWGRPVDGEVDIKPVLRRARQAAARKRGRKAGRP
jgi:hypothetical protein